MVKAALVQFGPHTANLVRYKNIRESEQLDSVLEEATQEKGLVVYTLVSPELRTYLASLARDANIPCVDLLGPLLVGIGSFFGYEPKSIAGLLHNVNDQYFKKIEAMEYTLQHDDGKDLNRLEEADLIILGISRTSKTPLSMYLSHQGWKVVNIPVIKGFEIPPEILKIDQRKIVGLTIDPEDLTTIRRNRLNRLGQSQGGDYANPENVNEELTYSEEIFKRNRRWPIFNVTGKALEETAAEIMKVMASRRLWT